MSSMPVRQGDPISAMARNALTSAAEVGESSRVNEGVLFGNPAGISLIERLDRLELSAQRNEKETLAVKLANEKEILAVKKKMLAIDEKALKYEERHEKQESQIRHLQNQLETVKEGTHAYRDLRNRFLETYKRDHHGVGYSQRVIDKGNRTAHHGDVVGDSLLYDATVMSRQDLRADLATFLEVYGLPVSDVIYLRQAGNVRAISLIDQRGSVKAGPFRDERLFMTMAAAFEAYLAEQMDTSGTDPSQVDPTSVLGRRYLQAHQSLMAIEKKAKQYSDNL